MSISTQTVTGLHFTYMLSTADLPPFEEVVWEERQALIQDGKGNTVFHVLFLIYQ